jgi:hypothetical protein
MTENDKTILRRWRDAEDRYKLFVCAVEMAQDGADRTVADIAEDADAYLGLDGIEDPELAPIVARIFAPMPEKYSNSRVFQKAADEHLTARDELLSFAQKLDGSKSANRNKSRKRS